MRHTFSVVCLLNKMQLIINAPYDADHEASQASVALAENSFHSYQFCTRCFFSIAATVPPPSIPLDRVNYYSVCNLFSTINVYNNITIPS